MKEMDSRLRGNDGGRGGNDGEASEMRGVHVSKTENSFNQLLRSNLISYRDRNIVL